MYTQKGGTLKRVGKDEMEMQAPEPDDLGVEKSYLIDAPDHESNFITPGHLWYVPGDAPPLYEDEVEGCYFVTIPFPENGFIYG